MPIYEFVCRECGHEFEKILAFSATTTPVCSSCGASNVERKIGHPAIHFKGSGWYINDSKKSNSKKGNDNSTSGASGDNDNAENSQKDTAVSAEKSEGAEPPARSSKEKATSKEKVKRSTSAD